MAVVTDPPWLNKSGGMAARNGTTSHALTFGFTATAGSLLVLFVGGSVTHSIASGWTERFQPVESSELSLFTRNAVGGETSVTVTHNGSNYPVGWCLYEFPPGSAFTTGAGSSPTNDTWPALSGLPGIEQVVLAARCRANQNASAGTTQVWNSPWVEDLDVTTPLATTDGTTVTVGRRNNVTTTSSTPSSTATNAGSQSTDRQVVIAAFDVVTTSSGPNEGSGSGEFGWSGSASGSRSSEAAGGEGEFSWLGSATGARTSEAAGEGEFNWLGSASGSRPSAGSAAGSWEFVGTADGTAPSVPGTGGTVSGGWSFAGAATGSRSPVGVAAGSMAWSGSAAGVRSSSGSAIGLFAWAGGAVGVNGEAVALLMTWLDAEGVTRSGRLFYGDLPVIDVVQA